MLQKIMRIVVISALVLGALTAVTVPTQSAAAAPSGTIVYNLYATDAFIKLVDGTVIYNYGFVGGREGVPLTYQNSWVAPPNAPKTFVPGANVTLPNGAPAPTGGPATATELQFAGNAQFPAPLIYAAVGDVVEIRLKNLGVTNKTSPNDPHTIHLHGMDVDAANDGVPETSVATVPANLAVPGAGNVVVYMFTPVYEGTYFYHCHQEADIHVQMGMYGALVIYSAADKADPNSAYNKGGPGMGYGGTQWGYSYAKDYIMLLTEVDVNQHVSEQQALGGAAAFNPVNYHPQYWFVNGLSFPQTAHTSIPLIFDWNTWSASHPNYDPMITGSVSKGEKVLIRMINMGFETQPMHMHGFHGKIIGSDQRPWTWANTPTTATGQGLEKQTVTIGSGEEYDWLLDFSSVGVTSTYHAATQSRYVAASGLPSANINTADPAIPVPGLQVKGAAPFTYIGGPTVSGLWGPTAAGSPSQIFVFHNHDDYKATNNGVYPGGMFTIIVPLN